jgi:predicted CopG family antitoxin
MAQTDKVKVQLDRDVATMLIQLKQCGDTYSDVIRKLLKNQKGDAQ